MDLSRILNPPDPKDGEQVEYFEKILGQTLKQAVSSPSDQDHSPSNFPNSLDQTNFSSSLGPKRTHSLLDILNPSEQVSSSLYQEFSPEDSCFQQYVEAGFHHEAKKVKREKPYSIVVSEPFGHSSSKLLRKEEGSETYSSTEDSEERSSSVSSLSSSVTSSLVPSPSASTITSLSISFSTSSLNSSTFATKLSPGYQSSVSSAASSPANSTAISLSVPYSRRNTSSSSSSSSLSSSSSSSSSHSPSVSPAVSPSPSTLPEGTWSRKKEKERNSAQERLVCDFPGCGQTFAHMCSLRRHARLHVNPVYYVCDFPGCDKRFAQRSNLKRHSQIHWK